MNKKIKIKDILTYLDSENIEYGFIGNEDEEVFGFSSLKNYKENTFTWIKNEQSINDAPKNASFKLCFMPFGISSDLDINNIIFSNDSKRAFFSTMEYYSDSKIEKNKIGANTFIGENVEIGENVFIGANCTIDGNIKIGDNTTIWHNVVIINNVVIGNNCDIRSGAIIGHDDFSYTEDENGKKRMVKHFGGVNIGNDVLISSNCCVQRGTIDDTIIEDGVKIDSLSQISHNSHIKKNASLAFPCSIGGSVTIGENAYVSGSIIRNQVKIGDSSFVGMGSVVTKDVEKGKVVYGNPAREHKKDN